MFLICSLCLSLSLSLSVWVLAVVPHMLSLSVVARDIRFNSSLVEDRVQVVLPAQGGNPLSVCARRWNMAAANVLCRDLKHPL